MFHLTTLKDKSEFDLITIEDDDDVSCATLEDVRERLHTEAQSDYLNNSIQSGNELQAQAHIPDKRSSCNGTGQSDDVEKGNQSGQLAPFENGYQSGGMWAENINNSVDNYCLNNSSQTAAVKSNRKIRQETNTPRHFQKDLASGYQGDKSVHTSVQVSSGQTGTESIGSLTYYPSQFKNNDNSDSSPFMSIDPTQQAIVIVNNHHNTTGIEVLSTSYISQEVLIAVHSVPYSTQPSIAHQGNVTKSINEDRTSKIINSENNESLASKRKDIAVHTSNHVPGQKPVNSEPPSSGENRQQINYNNQSNPPPKTSKWYKCDYVGCTDKFPTLKRLENHALFHISRECGICGVSFSTPELLLSHNRVSRLYQCCLIGCSKSFKTKALFKNHQFTHTEIRFHCDFYGCNACYSRKEDLQSHKQNHTCECRMCGSIFATPELLISHNRVGLNSYQCCFEGCTVSVQNQELLKSHQASHTSKRFYCDIYGCTASYLRLEYLKSHELSHACKCSICGETFSNLQHVRHHNVVEPGSKPFRCCLDECNLSFSNNYGLIRHQLVHNRRYFPCDFSGCSALFFRSDHLNIHKKFHSNKGVKYKALNCKDCNRTFASKYSLSTHRKSCTAIKRIGEIQVESALDSGENTLKPKINFYDILPKPNLESEITQPLNENLFKHDVPNCNVGLSTKNKLDIQENEQDGSFKCNILGCGASFLRPTSLKEHQDIVHMGLKRKCPFCVKSFKYLKSLKQHKLSHLRYLTPFKCVNGVYSYKCSYEGCNSVVDGEKLFQLHLQSHWHDTNVDKPYKCNISGCTESFAKLANLNNHKRVHTGSGIRLHTCDVNNCRAAFFLLDELKDHQSVDHDLVPSSGDTTLEHSDPDFNEEESEMIELKESIDVHDEVPIFKCEGETHNDGMCADKEGSEFDSSSVDNTQKTHLNIKPECNLNGSKHLSNYPIEQPNKNKNNHQIFSTMMNATPPKQSTDLQDNQDNLAAIDSCNLSSIKQEPHVIAPKSGLPKNKRFNQTDEDIILVEDSSDHEISSDNEQQNENEILNQSDDNDIIIIEDDTIPGCSVDSYTNEINAGANVSKNHNKQQLTEKDYQRSAVQSNDDIQRETQRQIMDEIKSYVCYYFGCAESFTSSIALQDHVRTHVGPWHLKCDTCGVVFTKPQHFQNHNLVGYGPKSFECCFGGCSLPFKSLIDLTKHQLSHSGQRFHCTFPGCLASFNAPDSLKNHESGHTDLTRDNGGCTTSTGKVQKKSPKGLQSTADTKLMEVSNELKVLTNSNISSEVGQTLTHINGVNPNAADSSESIAQNGIDSDLSCSNQCLLRNNSMENLDSHSDSHQSEEVIGASTDSTVLKKPLIQDDDEVTIIDDNYRDISKVVREVVQPQAPDKLSHCSDSKIFNNTPSGVVNSNQRHPNAPCEEVLKTDQSALENIHNNISAGISNQPSTSKSNTHALVKSEYTPSVVDFSDEINKSNTSHDSSVGNKIICQTETCQSISTVGKSTLQSNLEKCTVGTPVLSDENTLNASEIKTHTILNPTVAVSPSAETQTLPFQRKILEPIQRNEHDKTMEALKALAAAGPSSFQCGVCNAKFSRAQELNNHAKVHKAIAKSGMPNLPRKKNPTSIMSKEPKAQNSVQCDFCKLTFATVSDLSAHCLTGNTVKPFKCCFKNCQVVLKTLKTLNRHRVSHTGKRFYCDYPGCSEYFFRPESISGHKLLKHSDRYKCYFDNCTAFFNVKKDFDEHKRKHCEDPKTYTNRPWFDMVRENNVNYQTNINSENGRVSSIHTAQQSNLNRLDNVADNSDPEYGYDDRSMPPHQLSNINLEQNNLLGDHGGITEADISPRITSPNTVVTENERFNAGLKDRIKFDDAKDKQNCNLENDHVRQTQFSVEANSSIDASGTETYQNTAVNPPYEHVDTPSDFADNVIHSTIIKSEYTSPLVPINGVLLDERQSENTTLVNSKKYNDTPSLPLVNSEYTSNEALLQLKQMPNQCENTSLVTSEKLDKIPALVKSECTSSIVPTDQEKQIPCDETPLVGKCSSSNEKPNVKTGQNTVGKLSQSVEVVSQQPKFFPIKEYPIQRKENTEKKALDLVDYDITIMDDDDDSSDSEDSKPASIESNDDDSSDSEDSRPAGIESNDDDSGDSEDSRPAGIASNDGDSCDSEDNRPAGIASNDDDSGDSENSRPACIESNANEGGDQTSRDENCQRSFDNPNNESEKQPLLTAKTLQNNTFMKSTVQEEMLVEGLGKTMPDSTVFKEEEDDDNDIMLVYDDFKYSGSNKTDQSYDQPSGVLKATNFAIEANKITQSKINLECGDSSQNYRVEGQFQSTELINSFDNERIINENSKRPNSNLVRVDISNAIDQLKAYVHGQLIRNPRNVSPKIGNNPCNRSPDSVGNSGVFTDAQYLANKQILTNETLQKSLDISFAGIPSKELSTPDPSVLNTERSVAVVNKQIITDFEPHSQAQNNVCGVTVNSEGEPTVDPRTHTGVKSFKCVYNGCGASFSMIGKLKKHNLIHTAVKLYKCTHAGCNSAFSRSDHFRAHLKMHANVKLAIHRHLHGQKEEPNMSNVKRYKCYYAGCKSSFILYDKFKVHSRIHTGVKPYKCNYDGCKSAFGRKDHLKSHLIRHSIVKPYKCAHNGCGSSFKRFAHLKVHLETHSRVKVYKCVHDGCGSTFKSLDHLKLHRGKHTSVTVYKCDYDGCNSTFSELDHLKLHREKHTGIKVYKCDHDGCSSTFSELDHLKLHRVKHTSVKVYECDHDGCSSTFSVLYHLKLHQENHTSVKVYKCDHDGCSSTFSELDHLKLHQENHTSVKVYKCDHDGCSCTFSELDHLKLHQENHTSIKVYKCAHDGCSSAFKTFDDLKLHLEKHPSVIVYKCDHAGCNSTFKSLDHLTLHRANHTGVKVYKCDHDGCNSIFSKLDHLKVHLKLHAGEKPYKCDHAGCESSYNSASSLANHQHLHSQNVL